MLRNFTALALFLAALSVPLGAHAKTALLIAVGDAEQLSELALAKVMADQSSLWVSVRLQGRTRLALVTAQADVESAPTAHAWLTALDFTTRVRVAVPPGPLSACGSNTRFALADSGLPEPERVAALEFSQASSELELRRLLTDAELPVEDEPIAQFTSKAVPPYLVAIYELPARGGRTEALRLLDSDRPDELPQIALSGADTLPMSLIALAKEGVLPLAQDSADPSEFPVAYHALDQSSDYLAARRGWLAHDPARCLNEVQASAALFANTATPQGEPIMSAVSRYFGQLSAATSGSCQAQIHAARARGSVNAADFVCGGADDLARSLSELGFADLRLSRFWGLAGEGGAKFRVTQSMPKSPFLIATDFDQRGCPGISPPTNGASETPSSSLPPPVSTKPVTGPEDSPDDRTPVATAQGNTTVTVVNASSDDSCSGDSRPSDSRSDSCSGDSSSDSSAPSSDSCSGDSSSGDSSSDSCSGDSSSDADSESCSGDSSSDDSDYDSCSGDSSDSDYDSCSGDSDSSSDSGCSKSEGDADTCSGDSASGNSARRSAGLRSGGAAARPRPRQVRLSLLTLLAAALALPLRRLRASR